jgi:hypothetical protein
MEVGSPKISGLLRRFQSRVICILFLLSGLLLGSSNLLAQGPLPDQVPICALDLSTDSQEYIAPGPPIHIQMFLQVASSATIQNAKLVIEIDQQDGINLSLQSQPTVNLEGGFQLQGTIYSLDISQDVFSVVGPYQVHAQLQDAQGTLLCEGTTGFTVRSLWGQTTKTKTLIVTSPRQEFTEPFVVKLATWLSAYYETNVRVIHQQGLFQEYRAGMYKNYDVIIYYGLDPNQPPSQGFVNDVFNGDGVSKKKIVWIGYQFDRVQSQAQQALGFTFTRTIASKPRDLIYPYSNTHYDLENDTLMLAQVTNPDLARARAVITEGNQPEPIIVSSKRVNQSEGSDYFYFFGFHPTAFVTPFGAYLVFLDLMNEVYGINRARVALLRLEDVNAQTKSDDLLGVTGYLGSVQAAFTLALIPEYADSGGVRSRLSTDSDFRLMVKKSLLNGGEISIHGLTHQYHGSTPEDYEFWDPDRNAPVGDANYAKSRVLEALTEVSLAGLAQAVVSWTTPHYAASDAAYEVFEHYFSVLYEDPNRWGLDLKLVPFVTELHDNLYVNTDLGFVQGDNSDADIQRILTQARLLAGLQYGALASFYYHPFLGVDRIRQLVAGLKAQGWTFLNLSSYLNRLGLAPKAFIKPQS